MSILLWGTLHIACKFQMIAKIRRMKLNSTLTVYLHPDNLFYSIQWGQRLNKIYGGMLLVLLFPRTPTVCHLSLGTGQRLVKTVKNKQVMLSFKIGQNTRPAEMFITELRTKEQLLWALNILKGKRLCSKAPQTNDRKHKCYSA